MAGDPVPTTALSPESPQPDTPQSARRTLA
jgi:hypothetical protein